MLLVSCFQLLDRVFANGLISFCNIAQFLTITLCNCRAYLEIICLSSAIMMNLIYNIPILSFLYGQIVY